MTSKEFQIHSSFAELVPLYDAFILDQFGVMHNGTHGLEGAPECVATLAKKGKKLIILSNSSSNAEATKAKLPKLGFDPANFVGAVTSGEEAGHFIAKEYAGKKALFITWKTPKVPSPMKFLEMCGDIQITDKVKEADFIILHGVDVLRGPGEDGVATETDLGDFHETGSFDKIDPLLKQCFEQKLPMVCANPDFIMVRPDNTQASMPGKIVRRYEEMGGICTSFGKPHVSHFQACLRDLGLPKDRVVHVGDSLHHDIAGANGCGIDSVLVAGGVHREELGTELGQVPDKLALEKLFETHSQTPTHVVPMLRL
jgi:HAD superfamily hydrolase (TIGR01450 family)